MAEKQASTLGAHLKSLRTARGMSLAEVAAKTEISGSYLYYLEAGRRLKPP